GEAGMHAAGRVGDAKVVDYHLRLPPPDDHHLADRHLAPQSVPERLLNPDEHEAGEVGGAEIPPAAADDQEDQEKGAEAAEKDDAQASPHGPLALALTGRAVMPLVVRWRGHRAVGFVDVHSDGLGTC